MPYRMDVVDQGRGVVMTREGVVTQAELDESLARELAEPTPLERADYYLTDYRAVERFDVTPEGFRAHALAARALLDRVPELVMAAVVPDDLTFGKIRMWDLMSNPHAERPTGVFLHRHEAEAWIRERVGDDLTFGAE